MSQLEIKHRIARKQQEVDSLREQLLKAETYLAALKDVLKILPPDGDTVAEYIRPTSDLGLAKYYLNKLGHAAHIDSILTGIGKEVNAKNKTSLAGSLSSYSKAEKIFRKEGPNTFGLIKYEPQLGAID